MPRTAGHMPVWSEPQSFGDQIVAAARAADPAAEFAQSYAPETTPTAAADQPFGFGDLIDMVNPLQHIPLLNMAYRAITNDTIRPIGQIIGGAVFGGPLGAMAGAASTLITEPPTSAAMGFAPTPDLDGTTLALADLRHSAFISHTLNT